MTLAEAKKIAEGVLNGQTGSYVRAAHELAEFVMSLTPGVNMIPIEQSGPASPSVMPDVAIDVEEGELEGSEKVFDDIAHLLDEPGDEK